MKVLHGTWSCSFSKIHKGNIKVIVFPYVRVLQIDIGRVLEFWVMEATNIYDFLRLLSLIKMRPNMNFEGDLAFAHICHDTNFFPFFSQRKWRKAHKQRSKQEVRNTP
jgi:hypothetical protein